MLLDMAKAIAAPMTFHCTADREDAIGDALWHAVGQMHRFENRYAFTFFWKVLERQMIRRIGKQKRIRTHERQHFSD